MLGKIRFFILKERVIFTNFPLFCFISHEDGKVSVDCTDMSSPDAIQTEEAVVNELQSPSASDVVDGDTKTAEFCLHASSGTTGNHALGVEELSAKASDFASEKLDDPAAATTVASIVVPADDDQEMNKSLCMVDDHVTEQCSLGNGQVKETMDHKTEDLK